MYFTQQDVEFFLAKRDQFVHDISRGDITLGYQMFRTFLARIDQRVKLVDELLAGPFDFAIDEDMVSDPDVAKYPRDDQEARDLWRKRLKYDLLVQMADKKFGDNKKKGADKAQPAKPPEDPKVKLARRYHSFAKRMHQTDHDELLEMFLTSLTTSYDPHSTYMSPSTLENFDIQMKLELDGIGAQLQFDDGFTVVNKIIPGGAADKDGRLKAEDKVTGVGQGPDGEIEDVVDMKLQDVVQRIRGKRGTIVRLEVVPVSGGEKKIYNITRAQIELTDSEARSEIIEQKRNGQTFKIGVIDLPSFYMDMEGARRGKPDFRSTTRDMGRLLDEFREKHVDAVVLDLRRNGGGSLTEAINLTGLFVDEGPIVQVKDKNGKKTVYNDPDQGTKWDGPLVVITSKFSASASEIFAGAIQDYHRGLIVGDRSTHGKGTVQSLLDLGQQLFQLPNAPPLGALKITMQQFYRPNGDSTQNRGVRADIPLPALTAELDVGEADLDYALPFDKIDPAPFQRLNMVERARVEQLAAASAQRQKSSNDFHKVALEIDRYHELKARKTMPLNEAKFMAEREKLNIDKKEEEEHEQANDPHRPIFERNFYSNEVLEITLDYLSQFRLAANN
jgi:carboxyl-terminal processing protease